MHLGKWLRLLMIFALFFAASAHSESTLPICDKSDELDCKENCRTKFDDAFHKCIKECYAGRCVNKEVVEERAKREDESATQCVETESADCAEGCSKESSSKRANCRRACLMAVCPDANALDVGKESMDPGSLRCERCQSRYQPVCVRECALGIVRRHSGLVQLGCEKICVMSYCQDRCGARVPF